MASSVQNGVAGGGDSLAMIVSMGYTEEQAKVALEDNNGDVDDAIDALFLSRRCRSPKSIKSITSHDEEETNAGVEVAADYSSPPMETSALPTIKTSTEVEKLPLADEGIDEDVVEEATDVEVEVTEQLRSPPPPISPVIPTTLASNEVEVHPPSDKGTQIDVEAVEKGTDDGVEVTKDPSPSPPPVIAPVVPLTMTSNEVEVHPPSDKGTEIDVEAVEDVEEGQDVEAEVTKDPPLSPPVIAPVVPTVQTSNEVEERLPPVERAHFDEEATLPSTNMTSAMQVSDDSKRVSSTTSTSIPLSNGDADEQAPHSTDMNGKGGSSIQTWWSSKSSKTRKQLLAVGIFVLVLVLALAIAIPVSRNNKESSDGAPAPVSSEGGQAPSPSPPTGEQPTAPESRTQESLVELLSSVSADGGAALTTAGSAQDQALEWLVGNANLDAYSDSKVIQRYTLATLFYNTGGANWKDKWGWLSDDDECNPEGWFQSKGALEESFCNESGELVQLKLVFNRLNGAIPDEIGLLNSLEVLDLASNVLQGAIPIAVGDLSNLRTLVLSDNELTGNIPASIGALTNLERLWLYGNLLTNTIPESIGQLTSLVQLSFVWNNLSGPIPASIGELTALKELWMYQNRLSGPIPESIGQLANLERLWLYGNELTSIIPSTVGNMTKLLDLRLQDNSLGSEIPGEIRSMSSLNSLWLYDNDFTGDFDCPDFITLCYISCNDFADDRCREL